MVKTVDEGFREFISRLTPTSTEQEKASGHRASIEAVLTNYAGIKRFFQSGSYGSGTSIRGCSDVDYFACDSDFLSYRDSTYSLSKLRELLEQRFPFTDVRVKTPGVSISFADGSELTEVIPAFSYKVYDGIPSYLMPDGNGGWMESAPDAHDEYVKTTNDNYSKKVKPLIRFIKAWKYYQQVPISSFYLEMKTAKYANTQESIVYSHDVKNVFRELNSCSLAAMQDPTGLTGLITPCSTDTKREDALSKVKTALGRADKAILAEVSNNREDAFYWWRLLYNDTFPAYR